MSVPMISMITSRGFGTTPRLGRLPDQGAGRRPAGSFVDRVSPSGRVNRGESLIDAVYCRVGPGRPGILRGRRAEALRIGVLTGQPGMPESDDAAQRMRCGSGPARRARRCRVSSGRRGPGTGPARGCREHGQAYCQNRVDARTNLHLPPPSYAEPDRPSMPTWPGPERGCSQRQRCTGARGQRGQDAVVMVHDDLRRC